MLIDANTLQGKTHLIGSPKRCKYVSKPHQRLNDFLRLAKQVNKHIELKYVLPGKKYKKGHFIHTSLLIVPTREKCEINNRELKLVNKFILKGGSLFLMSNHNPYSLPNHSLARMAGVELHDAFFHRKGVYTRLEGALLNENHPVIKGINPPDTMVRSIVTNTCDAVSIESGHVFAWLPPGMNDRLGKNMASAGTAFGITREPGKSRILVIADSGLFGNSNTVYPGPGLLDEGDNRQFLINSLHWLFRIPF